MTYRPSFHAAAAVAVLSFVLMSGCSANRGDVNTAASTPSSAPSGTKAPGTSTTVTTRVPPRVQWDRVAMNPPIAFAGSPRPLDVADPAHPAPGGVYLWNDLTGWHVRVVRNPASAPVEVTVSANEHSGSSVKVTKIINSTAPLPAEATSVTVKLPSGATASGFDMSAGFYTSKLTFDVKAGSTPVSAGQIFLGQTPTPATGNPVELTRTSGPH